MVYYYVNGHGPVAQPVKALVFNRQKTGKRPGSNPTDDQACHFLIFLFSFSFFFQKYILLSYLLSFVFLSIYCSTGFLLVYL